MDAPVTTAWLEDAPGMNHRRWAETTCPGPGPDAPGGDPAQASTRLCLPGSDAVLHDGSAAERGGDPDPAEARAT